MFDKKKYNRDYQKKRKDHYNKLKRKWKRNNYESCKRTKNEWIKNNPEKWKAEEMLHNAIRTEKLILQKSKCTRCGEKNNLKFHHPDYDYPFTIEVLCASCHNKVHN